MAALHSRCGNYILHCDFFLSFFHSLPNLSGHRCLPYFDAWCGLSANLECMSEMCCTRLAGNTGCKKSPSAHHHTTLSDYIFVTKARIDNPKKIVKQQYLPHMSLQYGELWLSNGWDLLASLGHPSIFQRVSRLGSITARHSSSECQPNWR